MSDKEPTVEEMFQAPDLSYYRDPSDKHGVLRSKYPHYERALVLGDEPPVPCPPAWDSLTDAEWAQTKIQQPKKPKPVKEVTSFALHMTRYDTERYNRWRRRKQVSDVFERLTHKGGLVLSTDSYTNLQARSIWGLVWLYLRLRIHLWWSKK